MRKEFVIAGNILNVPERKVEPSRLLIRDGKIRDVTRLSTKSKNFLLPGFIDSHIHIESSMLTPYNFSRVAVRHGTVATVSDPHEIANVLGVEGIKYMIDNARETPMKFFFGAPSCVPATTFETSGAKISKNQIENLFESGQVKYLSEMMNYPGVIHGDKNVWDKIKLAKKFKLPVDGHAPGVRGKDLDKYIKAGISTDHECFSLDEAKEKLEKGLIIQIREGSAAKNFESLYSLIDLYPGQIMLCSDDLHPNDLLKGHMNLLLKRGIEKGLDIFNLLEAVSLLPKKHYDLNTGMLQVDDPADMVLIDNLEEFNIQETYIDGKIVFDRAGSLIEEKPQKQKNYFIESEITNKDIQIRAESSKMKVIECIDGELITKERILDPKIENQNVVPDIENDILKIIVINRYQNENPSVGFIKGFGLKRGAIISSIAHDSHNIICVGTDDKYILEAVQLIMHHKGGIAIYDGENLNALPLPVAGILSDQPAEFVANKYEELDKMAKIAGCKLYAPFMTLSFMALLVIPSLKISNKGLFNVEKFEFTNLFLMEK